MMYTYIGIIPVTDTLELFHHKHQGAVERDDLWPAENEENLRSKRNHNPNLIKMPCILLLVQLHKLVRVVYAVERAVSDDPMVHFW